jgi:hypothetical protein
LHDIPLLSFDLQQLVVCLASLIQLSPSQTLVPSGFLDSSSAAAAHASPSSWMSCSAEFFQAAMTTVNRCVDDLSQVCIGRQHHPYSLIPF